jgi:hypothetical protein
MTCYAALLASTDVGGNQLNVAALREASVARCFASSEKMD